MSLEGAACFSSLSDCQPILLQYAAARLRAEGCRPGLGPVSDYLQSSKGQQPLVVSQCQWSGHRARKCLIFRAGNLTLNRNARVVVIGDQQECISVRFPPLIKVLLSCRL